MTSQSLRQRIPQRCFRAFVNKHELKLDDFVLADSVELRRLFLLACLFSCEIQSFKCLRNTKKEN